MLKCIMSKQNTMQKNKSSKYEVLKHFNRYIRKGAKYYYFWVIIQSFCAIITPFVWIFLVEKITDSLAVNHSLKDAICLMTLYLILELLLGILMSFSSMFSKKKADEIERYVNHVICEKTMDLEYEHTENPEMLNLVEQSKSVVTMLKGGTQLVSLIAGSIASLVTIAGSFAVLVDAVPWLTIVLLALAVGVNLVNSKINDVNVEFFVRMIPFQRRVNYFYSTLADLRFAKDIRLYSLDTIVLGEGDKYIDEAIKGISKENVKKTVWYTFISEISPVIARLLVFLFVGMSVLDAKITIGMFSRVLASAIVMIMASYGILIAWKQLQVALMKSKCFVDLLEMAEQSDDGAPLDISEIEREGCKIEFKDVSFKYPRTDKYIIKNLNLVIVPEQRIAIVGMNGAGKTTLVKLLCRFYKPTSGQILLNGRNIEEYSMAEYNKIVSCVFQDFKLLAYTMRENIVVDDAITTKDNRIMELCDKINVRNTIERFDKKLDTIIYKYFDDSGVDLSGGEQQKVAILRAMYKDAPLVILDEPTSALDPISEAEIYENFNKMVNHKTAIYISHRLSSTRFCDRILVVDQGMVVEDGTHHELMELNGKYAMLFQSQAEFYK